MFDAKQELVHFTASGESRTCSEKNDTMVKITFPDNDQVLAATYKRYLPTEAALSAELTRERQEAERMLRLTAPAADNTDTDERNSGGDK